MSAKRATDDPGSLRRFKQTKLSFGLKASREEHPEDSLVEANEQGGDKGEQPAGGGVTSRSGGQQPTGGSTSRAVVHEYSATMDPVPQTRPQKPQEKNGRASGLVRVTEETGDLFGAPADSVLIHACNCAGHWGAGIAAAFKKRYPRAHKAHVAYCKSRTPEQLVGTAQLIPPCELDGAPRHYVGCLFTSRRYGRAKDSPRQILGATEPAMRDLLDQIEAARESGQLVAEIRMCRINSGLFAVPWEATKEAIEGLEREAGADIVAWDRDE